MKCVIVVAKYNEDIQWLDEFKRRGYSTIVYDKSDSPIPESIPLHNVGRESETFLRYIIDNYNILPDYVVFLQGDPFPHMISTTREMFPSDLTKLVESKPTNAVTLFLDGYPLCHDPNFFGGLLVKEYYEYLFEDTCPPIDKLVWSGGCQYLIPKQQILNRDIDVYKKLHSMVSKNIYTNTQESCFQSNPFLPNAMSPWTFERLATTLFKSDLPIRLGFVDK